MSLCTQHSAEGRLLLSLKTAPRAKGCACPGGRESQDTDNFVSTTTTSCYSCTHPPILWSLVLPNFQILGSPSLKQEGVVGTAPHGARAVPGTRQEGAC